MIQGHGMSSHGLHSADASERHAYSAHVICVCVWLCVCGCVCVFFFFLVFFLVFFFWFFLGFFFFLNPLFLASIRFCM